MPLFFIQTNVYSTCFRRIVRRVTLLAVLGLLPACETVAPPPVAVVPVVAISLPQRPTMLTAEAEAALTLAEQSMIEARVKRTMWSAAWEALQQARASAKIFDSEATLRYAKSATEFCNLGLKQVESPAVNWN